MGDRYRLHGEAGRGGMARVYRAEDLVRGGEVAIKVLRPELAAALGHDRFLREILQRRLERDGPLPFEDVIRIARDVAAALDHAHHHDVIHRDIKPGNVLLAQDRALVCDCGCPSARGGTQGGTVSGLERSCPHAQSEVTMPDALSELEGLSTLLLATSLATERLIAILKTVFPSLAKENTTAEKEVDLKADKQRRLVLQGLAVVASYVTVALVFDTWCPWKKVELGEWSYYQGVLAFLGSAGSAFWAGVVGYVKEVKDAKTVEVANGRRQFAVSAGANADGVGLQA